MSTAKKIWNDRVAILQKEQGGTFEAAHHMARVLYDFDFQNYCAEAAAENRVRIANSSSPTDIQPAPEGEKKKLWNSIVSEFQRKHGCSFDDAHAHCCVANGDVYRAYQEEASTTNTTRVANVQLYPGAGVRRKQLANAARGASEPAKQDSAFTIPSYVTAPLGLRDDAPLSAVREKLASGMMLSPGAKQMWTSAAVGEIQKNRGLSYLEAFDAFVVAVPELYAASVGSMGGKGFSS